MFLTFAFVVLENEKLFLDENEKLFLDVGR